jgi:hypothetical protein
MHFIGLHFIGMHLAGMHLIGVHLGRYRVCIEEEYKDETRTSTILEKGGHGRAEWLHLNYNWPRGTPPTRARLLLRGFSPVV